MSSIVSNSGAPVQPQLDITKTKAVICNCGNHTFVHSVFLREISEVASPTGKAGVIPIPTFTCNACGAVPDKVVPPFLKTEVQSVDTQRDANPVQKSSLTLLND